MYSRCPLSICSLTSTAAQHSPIPLSRTAIKSRGLMPCVLHSRLLVLAVALSLSHLEAMPMHEYVIDIPGTIRRWQRWRKIALLIAVLILLAYSAWYVWFLAM